MSSLRTNPSVRKRKVAEIQLATRKIARTPSSWKTTMSDVQACIARACPTKGTMDASQTKTNGVQTCFDEYVGMVIL